MFLQSFVEPCRAYAVARTNTLRWIRQWKFSALSLWHECLHRSRSRSPGHGRKVPFCGAFSVRDSVISWCLMSLLDSFVVTEHCWRRLQLVRYRLLSTCSLQTRLHPHPSLGATRFIGYRRNMLTRDNTSPGARSRKHCHMCIHVQQKLA